MLIILVPLIGLAIYGLYDGTMELREILIPVAIWAVVTVLAIAVFHSDIGVIIAMTALGIYFVMKIFGGDIVIPRF
ncbi:MAG: hypothetical protein ABJA67_07890 [Chthonomonadales bacterium]